MAGVVRFKFKSELGYDDLMFDGMFISIGDLKRHIGEKRNMIASELAIHKAETGESYGDEGFLLPRNSQVTVSRIPMGPMTKKVIAESGLGKMGAASARGPPGSYQQSDKFLSGKVDPLKPDMFSPIPGTDGLGGAAVGDEAAVLSQFVDASFNSWNSEVAAASGGKGRFGMRGKVKSEVPPPNYVCHRCGVGGHWIFNCPTNGNPEFDMKKVRAPVGIPLEKLMTSDDGTLVMPDGSVGDVMADDRALKKEASLLKGKETKMIPAELKCLICQGVINDAVLITCCQTSFCDSCIRPKLIETGCCPVCEKTNMLCDDLLPNPTLRKTIQTYIRSGETAEEATAADDGSEEQKQLTNDVSNTNPAAPTPNTTVEQPSNAVPQAPPLQPSNGDANAHQLRPTVASHVIQRPQLPKQPPVCSPSKPTVLVSPAADANVRPKLKLSTFKIPSAPPKAAGSSPHPVPGGDNSNGKGRGSSSPSPLGVLKVFRDVRARLPVGPRAFLEDAFCYDKPMSYQDFEYFRRKYERRSSSHHHRSHKRRRRDGGRDRGRTGDNSSRARAESSNSPPEQGRKRIVYNRTS
eukprot:CAMPEP_0198238278 /NCGR_PEP_ID=MMETSP1446-20131203/3974_1 /TAXON_ID=1461542 ORGANISM="Unidentified sp, Strain CCMP2111" /NCGR_SAMPLE_ID=MMETSP1446 /ASSEMBLY_ACC=CAM_ASM_001112 /LENGTH=577 /DNA_ID=CAMNT_0043920669 /DNA_START=333 /DNA_END=2066 /DNA_ORIENTATION=-